MLEEEPWMNCLAGFLLGGRQTPPIEIPLALIEIPLALIEIPLAGVGILLAGTPRPPPALEKDVYPPS
jgi:hypothetical protein